MDEYLSEKMKDVNFRTKMMADIREGDDAVRKKALNDFFKYFSPYIRNFAWKRYNRYSYYNDIREDLVGECNLAVMENIQKYDPQYCAATFFYPYLRGAMHNYHMKNNFGVSKHYYTVWNKIQEAIEYLTALGMEPTDENIEATTDSRITLKVIKSNRQVMQSAQQLVYLDAIRADEEGKDEGILCNLVDYRKPELKYEEILDKETIRKACDVCTRQERAILHLYYYEEESYSEIAARIRITPGEVKDIIGRCIQKLRKNIA